MKVEDLTVDYIKRIYLFGINLADIYGNAMSDELLQHYIDSAIAQTEKKFQILLKTTEIENEAHDHYSNDYSNWGYMQLHYKPVQKVNKMSMSFAESRLMDIPVDWIRVDKMSGQIQLFPSAGTSGSLMILGDGGSFMPFISRSYAYAPQLWRLSYTCGFDEIPADLIEYVCKKACIGILEIWGDLIIGAGIANQTISIDGLSQSIGTTQSPEFAGAGARIKSYRDDIKDLDQTLASAYLGLNVVVV